MAPAGTVRMEKIERVKLFREHQVKAHMEHLVLLGLDGKRICNAWP